MRHRNSTLFKKRGFIGTCLSRGLEDFSVEEWLEKFFFQEELGRRYLRRISWRRRWHPTLVLLPGKSHGRGAWKAAVHGVAKSQTRLRDFTFTFHSPALEKEMATHSSVLAWRIPGTGEPGGLLSMGSH